MKKLGFESNFVWVQTNLLHAYFERKECNFIMLAGDVRPICFTWSGFYGMSERVCVCVACVFVCVCVCVCVRVCVCVCLHAY